MLFNSYAFLFLFLPVALAGYYGLARIGPRVAAAWLAAASLVFYAWTDARLIVLLGASIAFNFGAGELILRQAERARAQGLLTAAAVTANLLLLFYYKYLTALLAFGAGWGLHLSQTPWSIVLPLGISFFTFTQIGYLIDCKAGIVKRSNLLDYVLFVTFFPHLIAGPILHHKEMIPQFANPATYRFDFENLLGGTMIFLFGLLKKIILADDLIPFVSRVFDVPHDVSCSRAWMGLLAYSLQLYFDFSGYSDMALGLAKMFGVRFPLNFNSPYKATSVIDFWQRWHMTLTRYLTLYIFNPIVLSLSRRRQTAGLPIGPKALREPRVFAVMVAYPIFCTMGLAGIWHGAGLQFLIFGLLHALYLTVNHLWRTFRPKSFRATDAGMSGLLKTAGSVGLTYSAVLLAQIFFRAQGTHHAMELLRTLAGLRHLAAPGAEPAPGLLQTLDASTSPTVTGGRGIITTELIWSTALLLLPRYAIVWLLPNTAQIFRSFAPSLTTVRSGSILDFEWTPGPGWSVLIALYGALALTALGGATEFLYFRF